MSVKTQEERVAERTKREVLHERVRRARKLETEARQSARYYLRHHDYSACIRWLVVAERQAAYAEGLSIGGAP